jgi:hypothetical protein
MIQFVFYKNPQNICIYQNRLVSLTHQNRNSIRIDRIMSTKTGYLVINLTDLNMVVYTYKKGVRDLTGASKSDMVKFSKRLLCNDYLIIEVNVEGFTRNKRGKYGE